MFPLKIFLQVLLWTFHVVSSQINDCPVEECRFHAKILPPRPILAMNGQPLPNVGISLFLEMPKNSTSNGCYVNTTRLFDRYNFTGSDVLAAVAFHCYGGFNLYMTVDERDKLNNVLSYIQFQKCVIGLRELSKLGAVVVPFSLMLKDVSIHRGKETCYDERQQTVDCSLFEPLSSIWIETSTESSAFKLSILSCNNTFPDVGELSLSYFDESLFPDIVQKFPRLQSLELPNSQFRLPPRFPWYNTLLRFPRNTSNLPYIVEQYTKMFHVSVDPFYHRRLFNLNSNNIRDLSQFQFEGMLHMLQLSMNGLKYIGNTTFSKIEGLQHLDLSRNEIDSLPTGSFFNLTDLRHIDLNSNKLTEIHDNTFVMNTKIIYLNIANNSLSVIGKNAFSKLANLKELNLANNNILTFPASSFPMYTNEFQVITLKKNPIDVLPVSVLYFRNLIHADFSATNISFSNFTDWLDNIEYLNLAESIVESVTIDTNLFRKPEKLRTIDLTGSHVKNIHFYNYFEKALEIRNWREVRRTKLLMVLKNFEFIFDKNPILCNCLINELNRFIWHERSKGVIEGNEYFFTDWKCEFPREFRGRSMLSVNSSETYCEEQVEYCPLKCVCFRRSVSKVIIVDCRNAGMLHFPERLPTGTLDIWFQNNNISQLEYRDYLKRVRQLRLSKNSINKINPESLYALSQAEELFLDSNYLVGLPAEIKELDVNLLLLQNNPFKCDCNTLWMKSWIVQKQFVIQMALEITCNVDDKDEEGKMFISVPDDEFVCLQDFDSLKHVVAPSIGCSLALALFITGICFTYIYRMEVKVLLYIYFGIHPFDKDDKESDEKIDLLVVHSPYLTEWVMKNVVTFLETHQNKYVICEMMRDFVAGFSYQENIASMVKQSRRMLILLSPDLVADDDLLKVAWNEAQEKIKDIRTNYVIVVCHMVSLKEINNKDLKRYIKRGRYIDTKHRLFSEKILYLMPVCNGSKEDAVRQLPDLKVNMNSMYGDDDEEFFERHAFIAYSDTDMGYTMNYLRPMLEQNGFTLCLPDRDFIPGASKEENILKAVDNCLHTIFVLSGDHLQDEWALFTFRSASERSLRHKCNHLIVLILDDIEMDSMDEEVCYYVKTHVTLNTDDPWFIDRLVKALPRIEDHKQNVNNGDTNFVQFKKGTGTEMYMNDNKLDDLRKFDFKNQPDILFLPENIEPKSAKDDDEKCLRHTKQNGNDVVYANEVFDVDAERGDNDTFS